MADPNEVNVQPEEERKGETAPSPMFGQSGIEDNQPDLEAPQPNREPKTLIETIEELIAQRQGLIGKEDFVLNAWEHRLEQVKANIAIRKRILEESVRQVQAVLRMVEASALVGLDVDRIYRFLREQVEYPVLPSRLPEEKDVGTES